MSLSMSPTSIELPMPPLEAPIDETAAERFSERVAALIDGGAVVMMMAIGHRTGLFDTLARLPPSTSAEIAEAASLAERYVREWLSAMTTGGIVEYAPETQTFRLPPEHAACLTREGSLGNLAVYAQFVAMMGQVQEQTLACFETGAGLCYHDYPDFHRVMAEESNQTVVAQLFTKLLPLVPGLTARLEAGIDVLDAGCGRGKALIAMARRFPVAVSPATTWAPMRSVTHGRTLRPRGSATFASRPET